MSIETVMPLNYLILCHPLLLLPSIFLRIRVFSNESALCNRWSKYWSFSFNISPSSEYSGLISFDIDCFDLLSVQRISKSLLQHHSSKASIFHCSAFFMFQLSHDYWEKHSFDYLDLCPQSSVSAFENSMFVIAFVPRSKHLLVSWLQSLSAVILEHPK